jgi:hypothetical protein
MKRFVSLWIRPIGCMSKTAGFSIDYQINDHDINTAHYYYLNRKCARCANMERLPYVPFFIMFHGITISYRRYTIGIDHLGIGCTIVNL